MKANKLFLSALLLGMSMGFTACSDDGEYSPAEKPTNAQVYFSGTQTMGDVTITMNDTEFDVVLCRANTNGELNVGLKKSGSEYMSVPSSVKFENGDSAVNFKVTFDPQEIGYENPQTLTISLSDSAALATPYGHSEFTINAVIPSPWTSLGMATVTEDIFTSFFDVGNPVFSVEIQENDLTPGLYRLVNVYTSAYPHNAPADYDGSKDEYMEIHAENPDQVWIGQTVWSTNWGYGNFITWSIADFRAQSGMTPEEIAANGLYGTLKDGEITFPAGALMISMSDYNEGAWYTANGSGLFSVLLPGYEKKDFSAEVQYTGIFTGVDQTTNAVANLTLGTDATDVKAIVMTQDDDAAAVADALASGDLEGTAVQAGRIEVPFNGEELGSEKLQIIVAVISDGAAKTVVTSNFEYYSGSGNPWKSIGMGQYTDGIIGPAFGGDALTYEVEIYEHSEQPGLYRVMNPYVLGVFPYAEAIGSAAQGTYLEINACDPEGVYVPLQPLGLKTQEGMLSYVSVGGDLIAAGYDYEEIKAGYYLGAVNDGVILLPTFVDQLSDGSEVYFQGYLVEGDYAYYSGNDNFCVVLPGATAPEGQAKVRSQFVRRLERNIVSNRYVPTLNKRLIKKNAKAVAF